MTQSIIEHLESKGFTYIAFDLAASATITAWRKTERKTYSVYRAPTLVEAEKTLLAMIENADNASAPPETAPADLDDILG